jgi:RNA polymerase sigma-70 factor (ECF subfamily)
VTGTADVAPLSDVELFQRFAPYVAKIGLSILGRESDVDDLVQDVFLAALSQRQQLRDPRAIKGWLATVAVRTARRRLRMRRVRAFVGIDDAAPSLELRDQRLSPEGEALLGKVYEVLDTLPVEDRLAWTLRHIEGEKLEEVAEKCGCSLATAKRRIDAAHTRLNRELGVRGVSHG